MIIRVFVEQQNQSVQSGHSESLDVTISCRKKDVDGLCQRHAGDLRFEILFRIRVSGQNHWNITQVYGLVHSLLTVFSYRREVNLV